jgi:hypothetical protein
MAPLLSDLVLDGLAVVGVVVVHGDCGIDRKAEEANPNVRAIPLSESYPTFAVAVW